jgi:hypothetical protein
MNEKSKSQQSNANLGFCACWPDAMGARESKPSNIYSGSFAKERAHEFTCEERLTQGDDGRSVKIADRAEHEVVLRGLIPSLAIGSKLLDRRGQFTGERVALSSPQHRNDYAQQSPRDRHDCPFGTSSLLQPFKHKPPTASLPHDPPS